MYSWRFQLSVAAASDGPGADGLQLPIKYFFSIRGPGFEFVVGTEINLNHYTILSVCDVRARVTRALLTSTQSINLSTIRGCNVVIL